MAEIATVCQNSCFHHHNIERLLAKRFRAHDYFPDSLASKWGQQNPRAGGVCYFQAKVFMQQVCLPPTLPVSAVWMQKTLKRSQKMEGSLSLHAPTRTVHAELPYK